MKTLVITGPSGSGKSYLTKRLSKIFDNSIIIKTDSYYKDNILIRLLSIFFFDTYDRVFSIKRSKIKSTLRSINNKDTLISLYKYDFKRKNSSKSIQSINYELDNQFIIVEGIFAHRLYLNYQDTINIICEEKKEICLKRRIKRDQVERGRNSKEVKRKFNRSWTLFYKNIQSYLNKNNVIAINTLDEISYHKLVLNLQTLKNN